jgi:glycerol-3-phosphate acyltransferase PlsY
MLIVMVFLLAGMSAGYLLRKKEKTIESIGRTTSGVIAILLFILGASIGSNEQIVKNITKVGFQAFLLTLGALLGSVSFSLLIQRIFLKKDLNQ